MTTQKTLITEELLIEKVTREAMEMYPGLSKQAALEYFIKHQDVVSRYKEVRSIRMEAENKKHWATRALQTINGNN